MEFMMAGFEIPAKKKSDDVMFDISLHGNPFNLVPVIWTLIMPFILYKAFVYHLQNP